MNLSHLRILNLIDDCPFSEVFEPLSDLGELVFLPTDQSRYESEATNCDAIITSLKLKSTAEFLARADRLKAIATPSTGLDHIDVKAAEELGIEIISLRGDTEFLTGITATAELAWGLLLSTARKIPWGFDAAKRGDWGRDRFRGTQLSGKTLGIVGFGRLGRILADYGRAFRLQVLATDDKQISTPEWVTQVSLEELLEQSDVVSIHIHLTEENRRLFGQPQFQNMKPGSILINTSRGGVIDEEAFLEALHKGPLAGAGIDVLNGEWREDLENHSLIEYARNHDNLVITPHVGGVTVESQRMAFERIVSKLVSYLQGESQHRGVNR